MLKEIVKDNLKSELQELIRRNKDTFERTENRYFLGKYQADEIALEMVEREL